MSIKNLTKDELITIIANMHDTVQEQGSDWGLSEKARKNLVPFGQEACTIAKEETTFDIPEVRTTKQVFTVYWLNGTYTELEGDTIVDALNGNGYGAGVVRAIAFHKKGPHDNEYVWDIKNGIWDKVNQNIVS